MIKGKLKMPRYMIPFLFCLLIGFLLIPNAHAQSEVNLQDIPKNLSKALGIPLYAGQLLTCAVFIFWLIFPTVVFIRKHLEYVLILEGFMLLGFFIAVAWIEYWYMLVYVLVVAGLWAGRMRGIFGGGH